MSEPAIAQPAPLAALFGRRRAAPPPAPAPVPPDPQASLDAAYAAGRADGAAAMHAELLPLRELLDAALAALRRAQTIDADALRTPFANLVTGLCETVLAAELRLAPEHVLALIEPALAALAPDGAVMLRLHPDDAALFAEHAPLPLPVAADSALARGSLRLETPRLVVADGFAARLAAVLEALPCR